MTEVYTWLPLIWILPLALAVVYVGSPLFLGTQAARRVGYLLKASLDNRRYTRLSDLKLSLAGRVVHFDHIVLSQTGIFVIDALHWPGSVSGSKVQAQWKRKHWGRSYRPDNPVHENFLRVQALQKSLNLPMSSLHPIVVISASGGVKTDAGNVVGDLSTLSRRIQSQSRPLLSQEQTSQALLDIQQLRVQPGLLGHHKRWKLLRLALLTCLCAAVYLAYGEQILQVQKMLKASVSAPAPAGSLNKESQQKLWENSLICSYSIDTGRCACYQPDGAKAAIEAARCKTLAEKGSVLQQ